MITLKDNRGLGYLLVNNDGQDRLIQLDWDYPSLASYFGWQVSDVVCDDDCDHNGTDGTVDCDDCDTKVIDFIDSAVEYLDNHIGDSIEDPGYFDNDD